MTPDKWDPLSEVPHEEVVKPQSRLERRNRWRTAGTTLWTSLLVFCVAGAVFRTFEACSEKAQKSNTAATVASGAPSGTTNAEQSQFTGVTKVSDIAKLEWVDKRCRTWAADGDIDVDQTCLVVRTVRGGLVVIPNAYNDAWFKEIFDPDSRKDKWIQRFLAIGGGAKFR
jgi:hypothetical protein